MAMMKEKKKPLIDVGLTLISFVHNVKLLAAKCDIAMPTVLYQSISRVETYKDRNRLL